MTPATEHGIAESVLAEMEARANAATPGPWWKHLTREKVPRLYIAANNTDDDEDNPVVSLAEILGEDVPWEDEWPDANFIANCRTDVPALIAEVRRLSRLSLYDPQDVFPIRKQSLVVIEDYLRSNGHTSMASVISKWLSTPESK